MRESFHLYRTSIGKKIVMAATGVVLVLFVLGHLVGNLKMYFGPEKFNAYAEGLRSFGAPFFGHEQFLWVVRVVLLACVGLHVASAWQTWRISRAARGIAYRKSAALSFSYDSRTMRWGGLILAAFVIFHLLHLTTGDAHPNFDPASPYANVVNAFRNPLAVVAYLVAQVALGFHLYHGLWSGCQTLNINNARIRALRRPAAMAVAIAVVAGYVSIPLSVLAGIVR